VGVAGYRIFRGGEEIGTSTTITYSDTGLTAGMTYSYAVSAYDATGNVSAPCPVVQVTPQEDDNQSLIPENRRIDWSHAGVPGGIPHRTVIYTTIDPEVYGNGETDASEAINAAIKECPEGQVVYLPAGTYKLSASIHFTSGSSGVTLRGAGPGLTTLVRDSNAAGITTAIYGLNNFMEITGGAVKGSTSIVVSDASSIVPGRILDICQADDPDFYWSRGNIPDHTGQYVMVTAVNGNTVEIEDPLVWTFDKNPRFRSAKSQGVSWIGIEDLTITADASRSGSMIQFSNAYASWIKNVETAWGNGNCHIYLYSCLRCEVRDSYIHDTHSTTDGYGILTMMGYGSGTGGTPRGGCTGMLIENNIFSDLGSSIILESEVGSVVAYNYSRNARASSGWANYQIHDFIGNHGPHGMMCLFEGNVASSGFQQDGYHGSVSHTTLFRNAFSGKHEDSNKTGNIKLIDLCRFSYYHNVIGNVLGNPEWPRDTIGRYEMTGIPGYTAQPVIYRLGYPNMGNNHYSETNPPSNGDSGGLDPKVKETLMRWGNFDYQNNMAKWDSSEIPEGVPIPTDHILPASLVYEEKPEWFGNAPWPAIGPDVDGLVQKIPAELRYEALQSGDTTPPAVPENLSSEVSQTTVNLRWTASTDNVAVVGYRIYRDGIQIGTSATNSYSDTDVTAGETYRYTISAYDAAGNESDQSVCKDVVAVDACILYIRADASSYGAGDGSDWNNAYSGFDEIDWENEMIKPGTIIYFSGGNYTSSIIPQKSGDNSAPIIIKRAVSNDHGTDTGWNAEMDSTAYFMDGAKISTSSREHLIIDGVKDYGIKVLAPYRVCNYAGVLLNGSNNIVQHALIDGNGDDWASVGVGLGGNANTLRYVKIRNTSNDAIKLKGTNHIIEYSIIEPYASNRVANACCSGNVCHADGIEIDGADNITIRYNEFSWPGDTLIFGINGGESDNWDIYGNVWHDGACIMKIQSNNRPQTNIRVYNNTFLNYGSIVLRGQEFDFRNNLFFNTNGIQEGSNIVVTDDPFINSVEGDYRLSKQSLPVNEGEPLSSQYNIDAFGNTRGADGHWDIGAYEYDATP
jgi:chitodextrinase